MEISNRYSHGDELWMVETSSKPKQFKITGPFEVHAVNAIVTSKGSEIYYTTNVKTELGMLKIFDTAKNVYGSLEEAYKAVQEKLVGAKKEEVQND